ncbi:MAG: hypothetical protein AB7U20_05090 [Planctomycetaceae bacterium]
MKPAPLVLGVLIAFLGETGTRQSAAAVIVISNRTDGVLDFEVRSGDDEPAKYRLQPHASEPIPVTRDVTLQVRQKRAETFELQPDALYFFGRGPEGLTLEKIGLSTSVEQQQSAEASAPAGDRDALAELGIVKVRILVDDELYTRRDPEPRLRDRVIAASAIFEQAARIRFDVAGVQRWESIDRISDFEALLFDLERKVAVEPGELAIGFSTQASRSKERMGATRLPLHSHILVRERGQRTLSEPALLELLVHELGHYLGAAHSPEWSSAMRPKLGDGLAGTPGTRIGLDPLNTMIVYLVGEELRRRPIRGIWDLSSDVKSRLRPIYTDLAKALPEDPAAAAYLKALDLTTAPRTTPLALTPLASHARHVVQAVTLAGEKNIQLPDKRVAERFGQPYRLSGEELTELYFRQAAAAARDVPKELRPHALAVGLAVAMDGSTQVRNNPLTGIMWRSIETDREHQFRTAVLGQPAMRDRYDLAQHFCVSAGLAALFGSRAAEAAGVWKERTDGKFSRADYSADLAGIAFFEHLEGDPPRLDRVADNFRITDYVPLCREADLQLSEPGGSNSSQTDDKLRAEIMREIGGLPAYVGSRAKRPP